MTMTQQQAVTILKQLGGTRFLAMTGAKNIVYGDGLQFSIPRRNKINKIIIKLNDNDLYDVEYWYIRGINFKKLCGDINVFVSDLGTMFTARTGLDCTL